MRSTMQVLHPQGLFINKPFYTSTAFTQALLLNKPCFYTKAFLHKTCFYTNAVFTQALSLHKHCFYTRPAFTQKRFYMTSFHSDAVFTQALSLHKHCFIQALLLHNDILLTKAFCNLQTGNRLEGRRNAEGCKYWSCKFTDIPTPTYRIYTCYHMFLMCYHNCGNFKFAR